MEKLGFEEGQIIHNILGGLQLCKFDKGFTTLYVNEGFTVITGYTLEDINSLFDGKYSPIIFEQDLHMVEEEVKRQLEENHKFSVEYRIIRKDKEMIWVMDQGSLIENKGGEQFVQCLLTDITLRKKQEQELLLMKKRYEIVMLSSELTMFEYNVITKELIMFEDTAKDYDMPTVIPNGMETLIQNGIIAKLTVPGYREMYRRIHAGEPSAKCLIISKNVNGESHEYELSLTNIFDEKGTPVRAIGVRKNVSGLILLETENEFGKNLLTGKVFVFEADVTNNKMEHLHDDWLCQITDIKNMNFAEIVEEVVKKGIHPKDKELLRQKLSKQNIEEEIASNNALFTFEYQRKWNEGEFHWFDAMVNIVVDKLSRVIRIRFYHRDITELKNREIELEYNAVHDIMTGAYNKTSTEEKIQEYLDSEEGRDGTHAFLMIDIDYFKNINDTFGHLFGDDVLKEVVQDIKSHFRKLDIVGRLGGDEFCVLMKYISSGQEIARKADTLCKKLCKKYSAKEKEGDISVSIGVAICDKESLTYEELYKRADILLYKAKANGRNRYEI